MNAAEALIRTAVDAGVKICFANPGTTELPLVAALDSVEGVRAILCLFEGVCTGAADGYARMSRAPALTLLHLGPGLANGIANLHNARRARSPVVNLVGQHATWHIAADAPLTSDIDSLAAPVSNWLRTVRNPDVLCEDFADAVSAAGRPPGNVATLVIPVDCQSGETAGPAPRRPPAQPAKPEDRLVDQAAAALLASRGQSAMLLGGRALSERGLPTAARVAVAAGCTLLCDTFPARLERGAGLPDVQRLPYYPEQAVSRLADFSLLILCGTGEPVAFFGTPGIPSFLTPGTCRTLPLTSPEQDSETALEWLADALHAPAKGISAPASLPDRPTGLLSPRTLGEAIVCAQPEGTILVDEAATSGLPQFLLSAGAPPFTYLSLTGGAIGQGLPCATGAALACPDRKVIAFQADGSGMYTLQALWTQAREGLDVTTVICANRSYRVLQLEMSRSGIKNPGAQARALTDLTRPPLDWVQLARGMGVPGSRAENAESFLQQFEGALSEPGPHLIEALVGVRS